MRPQLHDLRGGLPRGPRAEIRDVDRRQLGPHGVDRLEVAAGPRVEARLDGAGLLLRELSGRVAVEHEVAEGTIGQLHDVIPATPRLRRALVRNVLIRLRTVGTDKPTRAAVSSRVQQSK